MTSWYMAVSKALRTSGRLKAMTRTPGAASSISIRLYGMPSLRPRRRRPPAAWRPDDGLRRAADARGDGPADVVGEVDDDLADLLDRQLAAPERVVELDLQQLRLVLGRQDPDGQEAPIAQVDGVVGPHRPEEVVDGHVGVAPRQIRGVDGEPVDLLHLRHAGGAPAFGSLTRAPFSVEVVRSLPGGPDPSQVTVGDLDPACTSLGDPRAVAGY